MRNVQGLFLPPKLSAFLLPFAHVRGTAAKGEPCTSTGSLKNERLLHPFPLASSLKILQSRQVDCGISKAPTNKPCAVLPSYQTPPCLGRASRWNTARRSFPSRRSSDLATERPQAETRSKNVSVKHALKRDDKTVS